MHSLPSRCAAALACALAVSPSLAVDFPTETFEASPLSNASYGPGTIPGTALEIVTGIAAIGRDDAHSQNQFLDLFAGWYSSNFGYGTTEMGSTTVRSLATFDLLAGYQYTLAFDYSRQTFSAGNGPFEVHLTGALGSHSVTYDDTTGFYEGFDWQQGGMTWVQGANELGARVSFTAFGPGGYSGMDIDNVSLVGVAPTVAAPVPEPESYALMLGGLAAMGFVSRRRRRR